MKLKIDKSFVKDTKRINQKKVLTKLSALIRSIQEAETLSEIQHLKKIQGFESYYRIRLGDYRIGLEKEDDTLILIRFLHRKDIYKFFP